MLTTAEQEALNTMHGPNLYIAILGAVAMIVAAFGLKSSASTLISFGVMIGSLIWSNGKLSTTWQAAVHNKNLLTVVVAAAAYVASKAFGIVLPAGLLPVAGTMVTSLIIGNTVRKPVTAKATTTVTTASGSTTSEGA